MALVSTGCTAPRQPSSYLVGEPILQKKGQIAARVPEASSFQKPKRQGKATVFLDPGHGGHDPGAQTRTKTNRLREKTLTLEIVRRIERLLLTYGYDVSLSRSKDLFIPLRQRVEMAVNDHAAVFVSIHFNSASSKKGRGTEIYYFNDPKSPRTANSKRLGMCIMHRLCVGLPTLSRGVKHGNFCVVRETTMPAVLVEAAFITNTKDARLLTSPPYKQQIALAVARGIDDYFQKK